MAVFDGYRLGDFRLATSPAAHLIPDFSAKTIILHYLQIKDIVNLVMSYLDMDITLSDNSQRIIECEEVTLAFHERFLSNLNEAEMLAIREGEELEANNNAIQIALDDWLPTENELLQALDDLGTYNTNYLGGHYEYQI